MSLKTIVPPGEPRVIPLSCGGALGQAALFARDGQRIPAEQAEIQPHGFQTHHLYKDMPDGVYWAVTVIDAGVLEGRHMHFISVAAILVSQESGVREVSIGREIINFQPEKSYEQRVIDQMDEAGAPESVQQHVRLLYWNLS